MSKLIYISGSEILSFVQNETVRVSIDNEIKLQSGYPQTENRHELISILKDVRDFVGVVDGSIFYYIRKLLSKIQFHRGLIITDIASVLQPLRDATRIFTRQQEAKFLADIKKIHTYTRNLQQGQGDLIIDYVDSISKNPYKSCMRCGSFENVPSVMKPHLIEMGLEFAENKKSIISVFSMSDIPHGRVHLTDLVKEKPGILSEVKGRFFLGQGITKESVKNLAYEWRKNMDYLLERKEAFWGNLTPKAQEIIQPCIDFMGELVPPQYTGDYELFALSFVRQVNSNLARTITCTTLMDKITNVDDFKLAKLLNKTFDPSTKGKSNKLLSVQMKSIITLTWTTQKVDLDIHTRLLDEKDEIIRSGGRDVHIFFNQKNVGEAFFPFPISLDRDDRATSDKGQYTEICSWGKGLYDRGVRKIRIDVVNYSGRLSKGHKGVFLAIQIPGKEKQIHNIEVKKEYHGTGSNYFQNPVFTIDLEIFPETDEKLHELEEFFDIVRPTSNEELLEEFKWSEMGQQGRPAVVCITTPRDLGFKHNITSIPMDGTQITTDLSGDYVYVFENRRFGLVGEVESSDVRIFFTRTMFQFGSVGQKAFERMRDKLYTLPSHVEKKIHSFIEIV